MTKDTFTRNGTTRLTAVATLLLLSLLLGGCAGAGTTTSPTTVNTTSRAIADPDVVYLPFSYTAAVGNQSDPLPYHVSPDSSVIGTIRVQQRATDLLIEGQWSCRSPECDFRIKLRTPDDEYVMSISGSGTVRARIPAGMVLRQGDWRLDAMADSPVVGATGEFRVSVLYGALFPDGYTAFA